MFSEKHYEIVYHRKSECLPGIFAKSNFKNIWERLHETIGYTSFTSGAY